MRVEIGEVNSTVHALDGDALLSPRVLERIVAAVTRSLAENERSDKLAKSERSITGGVAAERDHEA